MIVPNGNSVESREEILKTYCSFVAGLSRKFNVKISDLLCKRIDVDEKENSIDFIASE